MGTVRTSHLVPGRPQVLAKCVRRRTLSKVSIRLDAGIARAVSLRQPHRRRASFSRFALAVRCTVRVEQLRQIRADDSPGKMCVHARIALALQRRADFIDVQAGRRQLIGSLYRSFFHAAVVARMFLARNELDQRSSGGRLASIARAWLSNSLAMVSRIVRIRSPNVAWARSRQCAA